MRPLFIAVIIMVIIMVILVGGIIIGQKKKKELEIVVARYEEDLSWLCEEPMLSFQQRMPQASFTLIIYNKGSAIPPRMIDRLYRHWSRVEITSLPNVGRCDHTFLYHITRRYSDWLSHRDQLVLFLPATCMENHKQTRTRQVLRALLRTQDTVLCGPPYSRDHAREFQLSEWKATSPRNYHANDESYLKPASPRPLGRWLDQHLPDRPLPVYTFYSVFAVHSRHVVQHPLDLYQRLLATVDDHSNPEAGHYLERSWSGLFYPYPASCIHLVE